MSLAHTPSHPPRLRATTAGELRFLWLELTDFCNLECVHCYAQSGPDRPLHGRLTTDDYLDLLDQARALGCRSVQFIGGEPTLHKGLPRLVRHARARGFRDVEVYTNATHLPPSLLSCFKQNAVSVAVSVYARDARTHDTVTGRSGSHRKTIANIARMVAADLDVRAAIVAMEANASEVEGARAMLADLGVRHVSVDAARAVGRGTAVSACDAGLGALCGQCGKDSLCVTPEGEVSGCIMSKAWPIGSVGDASLAEIIAGGALRDFRGLMQARGPDRAGPSCAPDDCMPSMFCPPSDPGCVPKRAIAPLTGRVGL